MQRIFLVLLAMVGSPASYSAYAQDLPLNLKVTTAGPTKNPQKDALYAIELSCKQQSATLQPVPENALFNTKYTTALSLFVGTQPPTAKPDGTAKLNGAVGYEPIALVNTGGEIAIDNTDACKQTFLVTNANSLFLVPTVSLTRTYEAGFFANFIDKVISLATAIAPAILTGGIAAPTAASLSAVQSSIKPMSDLIATLNKAQNYTKTQSLKVGKTVVMTDYTRITINVRAVPSIVAEPDRNQDLIDELKKSIDNAPNKLAATDQNPNCIPLAAILAKAGFRDPRDQAFALGYLAVNTFSSKDQIITCLGPKFALPAAKLGDLLWSGYPILVTVPDAMNIQRDDDTPTQPAFGSLKARLSNLMDALGGYARRDNSQPAPQTLVNRLASEFAPRVTIVDRASGALGQLDDSYSVPAVIDFLISKGFRRYGCFAQATAATGSDVAHATVIFLAFKTDPLATQARLQDGIAIHPIYQNNKMTTLRIGDNASGWIDAVLSDRKDAYYCNDLEILKKANDQATGNAR
jgi:hypothetical protein